MRDVFSIISFAVAVFAALAVMFNRNRDRQTVAAIVAGAFLAFFLINVTRESRLMLQIVCTVSFAVAVLGGAVTVLTKDTERRTAAIMTSLVSLGTSLLILIGYLEFVSP